MPSCAPGSLTDVFGGTCVMLSWLFFALETVEKGCLQPGVSSNVDIRIFLQKPRFFKLWCLHGQGGNGEEVIFFAILCALLSWTAPY